MLLTRSPHHSGPAKQVLDYLLSAEIRKDLGGNRHLLSRVPAPEILHGSPQLVGAYIDALPFKMRYSCWTLSFAPGDIDVALFNANDPEQRHAIDVALRLISELFFSGIPIPARPPWLAATHTHTGRLEVNILMPRAVGLPNERLRAWNPDPPTAASRNDLDAWVDVLNDAFGWSDPRCPLRRVALSPPSWFQKQEAEARRRMARNFLGPKPRHVVVAAASNAVEASLPFQQDTATFIEEALTGSGWTIRSVSRNGITCGPTSGTGSLLTLRGTAMGDRSADAVDPFDAVLARRAEVQGSYARLAETFQRRHDLNRALDPGTWPPCPPPEIGSTLELPPLGGTIKQRLTRLMRIIAKRIHTAFRTARVLSALTELPTQRLPTTANRLEDLNDQLSRILAAFQPDRAPDHPSRARARDGGHERPRPPQPAPLGSLADRPQPGADCRHDEPDGAAHVGPDAS